MTAPLDLNPIRERAAKAGKSAPLPWKFSPWHVEEAPDAVRCAAGWVVASTSDGDTALFIAHAPADIEALIARVEELEGALSKIADPGDGYTTGEGHAKCQQIARSALGSG